MGVIDFLLTVLGIMEKVTEPIADFLFPFFILWLIFMATAWLPAKVHRIHKELQAIREAIEKQHGRGA